MNRNLIAVALFFLFVLPVLTTLNTPETKASASFLGEPYGGFGYGSYDQNTVEGSVPGFYFGGRFGLALFGDQIFIAPDFRLGFVRLTSSGGNAGDNLQNMTLGVTGGYQFPILPLRVWAGFSFLDKQSGDIALAGQPIAQTYKGSSLKFGAGYEALSPLYLNLEVVIHSYSKLEFSGQELDTNLSITSFVLTASLPFHIGSSGSTRTEVAESSRLR